MQRTIPSPEFLDQAQRKREQAKRCRALLSDVGQDHRAAALLNEYAAELEQRAETLEGLAGSPATRGRSIPSGNGADADR